MGGAGDPDAGGTVVVVTGGTSGIGRAAVRRLAGAGATVLVTGRDPDRGAAVVDEAASTPGDATFLRADLADLDAVRDLAAAVRDRTDRLDALVNNAACAPGERRLTAAGVEETFAVNHLAHFLLTHRLADRLAAGAPARVVTVASEVHRRGTLDLDAVTAADEDYEALSAYARSKLANLLFAFELADRLAGTGVTSNAVHPGFVPGSRLYRESSLRVRLTTRLAGLLPGAGTSVSEGGARVARLATAPTLADTTGTYFEGREPAVPSSVARDEAARRRLWAWSVDRAGVDPDLDLPTGSG